MGAELECNRGYKESISPGEGEQDGRGEKVNDQITLRYFQSSV
jgi:hypothetical protein